MAGDFSEGAKGAAEAFFGDQATGLDQVPSAAGGGGTGLIGPVVQGNAGALEAQFIWGAAEGGETFEEGFGSREDEAGALKDLLEGGPPRRALGVDPDVGAVKGHHHGARGGRDEGK